MSLRTSELPAAGTLTGNELIELSRESTTITMTASTISAVAATNSFHDSAGNFLVYNFAVGQAIKSSGFTGAGANNKQARVITALTATDMTFGGTDGDDIVDDAEGESVTLTAWVSVQSTQQALQDKVQGYTPADLADWEGGSDPGDINDAADVLAARTAAMLGAAEGDLLVFDGTNWVKLPKGAVGTVLAIGNSAFGFTENPQWIANGAATESWGYACSDEETPIDATGVKVTFPVPYALKLISVFAGLATPQTSGSTFTIDVKQNGTSIFTTLLTIDNGEYFSSTAAVPAVIDTAAPIYGGLTANTKVTVEVTQVGDGTAVGLKVYFIGYFVLALP